MTKIQVAPVVLALAGCAFGGSSGDPTVEIQLPNDAAAMMGSIDAASGSLPPSDTGGPSSRTTDASDGAQPDASSTDTSAARDSGSDAQGPGDAGSSACEPAVMIVSCDPVRNTGCPPLTQCDLDPDQSTATGRCVFSQSADAGQCAANSLSESCAPGSTCVAGVCRTLCYCDADCGPGACCSDPSGAGPSHVFKLCQPC